MNKSKFIKWIKKPENWVPFIAYAGILTVIAASWMTIFFVEYGPYFDKAYQEALFQGFAWNQVGVRNDYISVYVDGASYWEVTSAVDFGGKSDYGSRVLSNNSNGAGVAYKIEGGDSYMCSYPIVEGHLDTKNGKNNPLISSEEFAKMVISVDLPVNEMSFRPKMDNISVFKKDNALVSYATMPSDKDYSLNIVGWEKEMTLTQVSLFSYTHPWKEDSDVRYTKGYKISGYNDGDFVEIFWGIRGWLN